MLEVNSLVGIGASRANRRLSKVLSLGVILRLQIGFEVREFESFSGSCDAMHLLQETMLSCNRGRLAAVLLAVHTSQSHQLFGFLLHHLSS